MKLIYTSILMFVLGINNASATDSTTIEILFSFNKHTITTELEESINKQLINLDTTNNIITNIAVYGHTDQIGSHQYNDTLSIKRANATAIYLQQIGVVNKPIVIIAGLGKHQLKTPLMTPKDRATNRRVVITIFYKKKPLPVEQPKIETPKLNEGKALEPKPKTQTLADKIKDTLLKVGDKIELPFILFYGGEHIFLQFSYPYLDELVSLMQNNPTLEIEIQGHICCTNEADGYDFGTGKKNLSVARAKAVYDFLKANNINKKRMSYIGFGHQFPITQERTEAEKTRNRRVEIKILQK